MTTDMLRGVLDTGSAYSLKGTFLYNQDWAGKTGTTQDAKDSLFVAYNPKVTMGIWMGYDVPTTFDEENHYQLKLWRDIVNQISSIDQSQMGVGERFNQPKSVTKQNICQFTNNTSGCVSGESTKESLVSDKTDLTQKTLDTPDVLNRLGIKLDPATKSKIFTKSKQNTQKKKRN